MNPQEQKYIDSQFTNVLDRLSRQDKVLDRLDHTINGNGKPGLKTTVDSHERSLKLAKRIMWIVLTPVLAAVGGGIVTGALYLIHVINK